MVSTDSRRLGWGARRPGRRRWGCRCRRRWSRCCRYRTHQPERQDTGLHPRKLPGMLNKNEWEMLYIIIEINSQSNDLCLYSHYDNLLQFNSHKLYFIKLRPCLKIKKLIISNTGHKTNNYSVLRYDKTE